MRSARHAVATSLNHAKNPAQHAFLITQSIAFLVYFGYNIKKGGIC